MKKQLKNEINRFRKWSHNLTYICETERCGEWEEDYEEWDNIFILFTEFIETESYLTWKTEDIESILYLIARNNEPENLIEEIVTKQPNSLELLANKSLEFGEMMAKWQIAINLDKLSNKKTAVSLLEKFLIDENEYVRRRALVKIAEFNHPNIEIFCEQTWNRKDKSQEYSRIAVLISLEKVHSTELQKYLKLAREDGRKYLVMNAEKIKEKTKV